MNLETLIDIRCELHRRAELSFQEHQTQQYICDMLTGLGIAHSSIVSTGVLAVLGDASLPAVVLRADIDALPIDEGVGFDYCSLQRGVMHACGHDMHSAMLIGALSALSADVPADRCVVAIFQPAEELNPGGASMILAQGVLDRFDVRAVVGQHVSPELAVGQIGYRAGRFMASADEIHILVIGQGGHAARPLELRNAVRAAVELLFELDKLRPDDSQIDHLLTFGRVEADGATNIVPDRVVIAGTLRTFDELWRHRCIEQIKQEARRIGESHHLIVEVSIGQGYSAVFNDEGLTDQVVRIVGDQLSQYSLVEVPMRMTAEDFGNYTVRYPSIFLRLGVGTLTRLHSAQFAPDQSALLVGSRLLESLARNISV